MNLCIKTWFPVGFSPKPVHSLYFWFCRYGPPLDQLVHTFPISISIKMHVTVHRHSRSSTLGSDPEHLKSGTLAPWRRGHVGHDVFVCSWPAGPGCKPWMWRRVCLCLCMCIYCDLVLPIILVVFVCHWLWFMHVFIFTFGVAHGGIAKTINHLKLQVRCLVFARAMFSHLCSTTTSPSRWGFHMTPDSLLGWSFAHPRSSHSII